VYHFLNARARSRALSRVELVTVRITHCIALIVLVFDPLIILSLFTHFSTPLHSFVHSFIPSFLHSFIHSSNQNRRSINRARLYSGGVYSKNSHCTLSLFVSLSLSLNPSFVCVAPPILLTPPISHRARFIRFVMHSFFVPGRRLFHPYTYACLLSCSPKHRSMCMFFGCFFFQIANS